MVKKTIIICDIIMLFLSILGEYTKKKKLIKQKRIKFCIFTIEKKKNCSKISYQIDYFVRQTMMIHSIQDLFFIIIIVQQLNWWSFHKIVKRIDTVPFTLVICHCSSGSSSIDIKIPFAGYLVVKDTGLIIKSFQVFEFLLVFQLIPIPTSSNVFIIPFSEYHGQILSKSRPLILITLLWVLICNEILPIKVF